MSKQHVTPTLKLDPWAASSLLQKTIRRGQADLAKFAARTLYRQRGKAIWRRLMTIACEDVGIGDPELVLEVVRLATDEHLRAIIGDDIEILLDLCQRLADASKDRAADYLICSATKLPAGQHERLLLASMGSADQIAIAADPNEPLIRRAVATLLACTIDGEGKEVSRNGTLQGGLLAPLENVCPSPLHDAVDVATTKPGYAFALMLPLLASALATERSHPQVVLDPLPSTETIGQVPLFTYDKHTALGKQAISIFARENRVVQDVLKAYVPEAARERVVLMAAFYADAIPIARRLDWDQSRSLEALGLEADMFGAGCPQASAVPIVDCVRRNLDHLYEIRRRLLLRKMLETADFSHFQMSNDSPKC